MQAQPQDALAQRMRQGPGFPNGCRTPGPWVGRGLGRRLPFSALITHSQSVLTRLILLASIEFLQIDLLFSTDGRRSPRQRQRPAEAPCRATAARSRLLAAVDVVGHVEPRRRD